MTDDVFSPLERAMREECLKRKMPQPDMWEERGIHTSRLAKTSEVYAAYTRYENIREDDVRYAPEVLTLGRMVETTEGNVISEVSVMLQYIGLEGHEPIITVDDGGGEIPNVTFKGRKQVEQMGDFFRMAEALIGPYAGRRGKEVDAELLGDIARDYFDLVEIALEHFTPVADNGLPPFSEN
jgi:hypothetical protein